MDHFITEYEVDGNMDIVRYTFIFLPVHLTYSVLSVEKIYERRSPGLQVSILTDDEVAISFFLFCFSDLLWYNFSEICFLYLLTNVTTVTTTCPSLFLATGIYKISTFRVGSYNSNHPYNFIEAPQKLGFVFAKQI